MAALGARVRPAAVVAVAGESPVSWLSRLTVAQAYQIDPRLGWLWDLGAVRRPVWTAPYGVRVDPRARLDSSPGGAAGSAGPYPVVFRCRPGPTLP